MIGIASTGRQGAGPKAQQFWTWVTGPDYYLDEDGADLPDLDEHRSFVAGDWWTCDKQTLEGDLILLYRSQIKKDIAYLIKARSDAYRLRSGEVPAELHWDFACDYEVIEKFDTPLKIRDMRSDPLLADWNALRANFRRRVYKVSSPAIWDHLLDQLSADPVATTVLLTQAERRFGREREIEDYLASHMDVLAEHGPRLVLHARQYVCLNGGRADLVGFDPRKKRYAAIELKAGVVDRRAVGQALSYRASLKDEFPSRHRPIGILIGERTNGEAAGMIRNDRWLSFISLSQVLPH